RHYTLMRLALPRDAAFCITASPATQLSLARTADQQAESLIRDIRDGTLNAQLDIPPQLRAALQPHLRADTPTAARLEQLAARHGRLLPKHYWRLDFLANWTGGTMGLYLRDFPEYFGDTPVRDIGLLASEGRMSIPITDGTAAGLLDVVNNFFEFIPVEEYESASPSVLRCHELTAGREYYILLTTSAGFYRYDIGDVVRVVDYVGPTPMIEFLHKGAHVSSLTGEKINERQVVLAFERACRTLGQESGLFVLAPHWADPPFYRLHLDGPASGGSLAIEMDRQLQAINVEYASKRHSQRLGPIEPHLLPPGTLAQADSLLATRHRRANDQFKHRYLFTRLGEDKHLVLTDSRVNRDCAAAS
ncbi:MAG TPA: GH3 auxin-responsive promoter family protein, partial [Phycisphaerae bacterium]